MVEGRQQPGDGAADGVVDDVGRVFGVEARKQGRGLQVLAKRSPGGEGLDGEGPGTVDVVGVVVAVGLGVALVRLMPPKLHPLFLCRRGALTSLLVRGLQRSMPSLWTLLSLTTVQSTCFGHRPPLHLRKWNRSMVYQLMLPAPRSLQWFCRTLGLLH